MHYGCPVATITIKDIPDSVHSALKSRANAHGRSLNREVLRCLEVAVSAPRIDVESVLAGVDRIRADGVRLDAELLERARKSGRP